MVKKLVIFLGAMMMVKGVHAQTSYIPLNQDEYLLADRLETLSGSLNQEFFTGIKPIPRKGAVAFFLEQQSDSGLLQLSKTDLHNLSRAISASGEWAPGGQGAEDSRHSWFRTFYVKKPDFFYVKTPNFFLSVNPVISAQLMREETRGKNFQKFWSTRGLELRGWINKKIGFYTYLADNQEQVPEFVDQWIEKYRAVPGADFYSKPGGKHYDYFQARGYVDVAAMANHINLSFGYDRHFLGDGIRSLFLSDFGTGATFFRINTRIWKLNYQNLYLELTPQFFKTGRDELLPHKYAVIHTLSLNATRWLNLGLFESVVFSRPNRFEFGYMNPLIFYRAVERGLGSPDNVNLGFNFKALPLRQVQLYGQLMLDEFKAKELFSRSGWWGNKFGVQSGVKYFNVAGVKNLDIQGEVNVVRPYTYSHLDTTANYTHYNQPLAHPLGAGFREVLGIIRYQPVRNLLVTLKSMYYQQGTDTGMVNFGNNIFLDYSSRNAEYNIGMIHGPRVTVALLNLTLSYELKDNLFLDLGFTRRSRTMENNLAPDQSTSYFFGGLRLNIARRDYDFY